MTVNQSTVTRPARSRSSGLWSPWSANRPKESPIMLVRGEGVRVVDTAGTRYLDAASGAMNAICGHGREDIADAISGQLRLLAHTDLSTTQHGPALELARAISDRAPAGLTETFFCTSGSEGIEAALRMAVNGWANRGSNRRRIVTFERGYHGSTALVQSLSGLPATSADLASSLPITRVPLVRGQDAETLADAFAAAIEGATGGSDVAAVLVEPLLNVGGGYVLPAGFLTRLREICDRVGALLILDEVFTGFGRLGAMFGADLEGVRPDVLVTSKGLTAGYMPISSVSATAEVREAFDTDPVFGGLRYGHTMSGHAAGCAAGLAVLDIIDREGLVTNAADRGRQLAARLAELQGEPGVAEVRGQGLAQVVEMRTSETAAALLHALKENGVLARQQEGSVLFVPPLVIDADETDELADAVVRCGRSLR